MSVRIREAYRCPIAVFSATFLPAYRRHCFRTAGKFVLAAMQRLSEDEVLAIYDARGWRYPADPETPKERTVKLANYRCILDKAAEASLSSHREPEFDIDCSLNIWISGRHVYCIPYGERHVRAGFRRPQSVEDYAYWDDIDRPARIDPRAWKARGKVWDTVCLDDWDGCRLTHEIVRAGLPKVGLSELRRIVFPEDKR